MTVPVTPPPHSPIPRGPTGRSTLMAHEVIRQHLPLLDEGGRGDAV